MTTKDHLEELYTSLGLDINDQINMGEICAYSIGVDMLKIYVIQNPYMMFVQPNKNKVNQIFENEEFFIENKNLIFKKYDPFTIGKKVKDWILPIVGVKLGNSGSSWQQIDERNIDWKLYSDMMYTWSMLESEVTL